MTEAPEPNLVQTEYGWAKASPTPPRRTDLFWLKLPERHVYFWDGDGWYRFQPPERASTEAKDLTHG